MLDSVGHVQSTKVENVAAQPAVVIDTLVTLADTLRTKSVAEWKARTRPDPAALRKRTQGRIEVGGIYGQVPFASESTGPWNAFAKGNVSVNMLGIPVGVLFDVGTDVPVRGQRNTLRFSFDAPRALETEQWNDAHQLHRLTGRLDSLETLRANTYRTLKGNEARLAALGGDALPELPQAALPDTLLSRDPLQGVPSLPSPSLSDVPTPTMSALDATQLDSLTSSSAATRERLQQLDAQVQDHRMQVQRLSAVVNATHGKEGLVAQFAKGIKRLDIGSCSPNASEFLINGLNFQGLSFEYAHKDVFFSLDRGRSFDDTWQNTDPVSRNLRLLQQSLFFADARDLNPRKLTALRSGFGEVQRTHVHVGYLNGKRDDLPLGVTAPGTSGIPLTNHVVEFDLGVAIKKVHLLRAVYARSVVQSASALDDTGRPRAGVADLFNVQGDKDQALKLIWSSDLQRTGTHIDLEGRSISPFFQSFGMGFVRNGSRAVEVRLDQAIGKRLRLRGRSTMEERQIPGGANGTMSLQRLQALLSYRPSQTITLRAGFLPVHTRTELGDGSMLSTTNRSYTLGGDFRKRWRSVVLMMNADGGLYAWRSPQGAEQVVENHTVGLTLQHTDRWNARIAWTGMSGIADSLTTNTDNLTIQCAYTTRSGWSTDASVQVPRGYATGWLVAVRKQIGKQITLSMKGEHYARSVTLFTNDQLLDQNNAYTWTASMIYQW